MMVMIMVELGRWDHERELRSGNHKGWRWEDTGDYIYFPIQAARSCGREMRYICGISEVRGKFRVKVTAFQTWAQ